MDLREDLSPPIRLSLAPGHMRKHPEVSHDHERMRDVMRGDLIPEGNCHQDRAGLERVPYSVISNNMGNNMVMMIKGGLHI